MVRVRNVKPKSSSNQEAAAPSLFALTVLSNVVVDSGTSTASTHAGVSEQNNDAGTLQIPYQGCSKNGGGDLIPTRVETFPVLDITDRDFTNPSYHAGNDIQANIEIAAPSSCDKGATNSKCSGGVKSQESVTSLRSFLSTTPIYSVSDDDDDFFEPPPKTPKLSSSSKKEQKVSQSAARSSKKRTSLPKNKTSNSNSTRVKKSPPHVERGLLETLLTKPVTEFPCFQNDNVAGSENRDLSEKDRENGIIGEEIVIPADNPTPLQMPACDDVVLPAAPSTHRGIGVGVKRIELSDISDSETESLVCSQDSDNEAIQTVRHIIKNIKRKRDEAFATVNDCNEQLRSAEEERQRYIAKLQELEFRMGDLQEQSAEAQAIVDGADKKLTAIQGRLGL